MNIKNLVLLFFVIATLSFAISCKDEQPKPTPNFEIPAESLTQEFIQAGGSVEIPVITNLAANEWSIVSSEPNWCIVTQLASNRGLKIVLKKNEEVDIRTATVTVSSSINEYQIAVTQLGYGKAIIVNTPTLEIPATGGNAMIRVTANVPYTYSIPEDAIWLTEIKTKALEEREYNFVVERNNTYIPRSAQIEFVCTDDPEVKAVCVISQKEKAGAIQEVVTDKDILIKPSSGTASEFQPGSGIERCWDDEWVQYAYHSPWGQSANFPVKLTFNFTGNPDIDYVIYHTRSGNGNFGRVKILYTTLGNPTFKEYGEYDFQEKDAPSKVSFGEGLKKVTQIRFEVYSGLGNFVSCREMQFFKRNTGGALNEKLLQVFTDLSCSQVKPDATQDAIDALPSFFAANATLLKTNTYNEYEKSFRIRAYKPYSDPDVWANKLMTKKYSPLSNITGVYANAGDSVIVCVGPTYGNAISLQCIPDGAVSGESFFLEEGVNKIGVKNSGLFYVIYNTELTLPNAKPITIHFPMGSAKVNGFFDLDEHKTDAAYRELLAKATFPFFNMRGHNMTHTYHTAELRKVAPNGILEAINLWDDLLGWQLDLMGITDVRPSQFNNHINSISFEGDGYMWASNYRIGFHRNTLYKILSRTAILADKDNVWGPAHEIGHIHQKAINWPGTTESSNNLFSNFSLYKMGKYCSRGSELSRLAEEYFIDKNPFVTFKGSYQNEDTELHMRMNWQLWNYYHRLEVKPNFFPTLFKLMRQSNIPETNPGLCQYTFMKNACIAAGEDLTDFFELWGMLRPYNGPIEQYGSFTFTLTSTQVSVLKDFMKQYPKPKQAFYYLEDRKNGDLGIDGYNVGDIGHYSTFASNKQITKTPRYTLSGQTVTIVDGEEGVMYEIYKNGQLVYFFNFNRFTVPGDIPLSGATFFVVQADGKRVQAMSY